ncbi:hypothetical protein [Ereboglobus luteus]|uniref:hypothetical protein n=1 Tax=Ereboglobus luteus TaxID=1796921 RepID=UPI001F2B37EB|nr:hypothetical protein [Ereboglobus luteus]
MTTKRLGLELLYITDDALVAHCEMNGGSHPIATQPTPVTADASSPALTPSAPIVPSAT